jgi:hypothetical protein
VYEDPRTPGLLTGVGIESQDIESMADEMARDLAATPQLMNHVSPARVVIDAEYFRNESSSRVNKNLITDRLRVLLNRNAAGRIQFLGRSYADMTEKERELEQAGIVTGGTQGRTSQALGYDYRMGGRIATIDQLDPRTGIASKYYQITFEMVARGSGLLVWSNQYIFKKTAQDDIVYQ